jgi:cytochrome bd-type quinol oxidase subunit 1
MAQTDQLQQADPAVVAPSSGIQPRSRIRTSLRLLWRYRVFVAGMLAIALAIAGEIMMRTPASPGAQNGWVAVGTLFMAIAALLVGLVAWVDE